MRLLLRIIRMALLTGTRPFRQGDTNNHPSFRLLSFPQTVLRAYIQTL